MTTTIQSPAEPKCACPACSSCGKDFRRGWCAWCWKNCVVDMAYQGEHKYGTPSSEVCAQVHAGKMRRRQPAEQNARGEAVTLGDIIREYGRESVVAHYGEARVREWESVAMDAAQKAVKVHGVVREALPLIRRIRSLFG